MNNQYREVQTDVRNRFYTVLRDQRLNNESVPDRPQTAQLLERASRNICVSSLEELSSFTNEFKQFLSPGNLAFLPDSLTGETRMFLWINDTIMWQEIILKADPPPPVDPPVDEGPKGVPTFASEADLQTYLAGPDAYAGQLVTIVDTTTRLVTVYKINIDMSFEEIGVGGVGTGGSGNVLYKGLKTSYSSLGSLTDPQEGWLVSVYPDETDQDNKNIYIYSAGGWKQLTNKNWASSSMPPSNTSILWIDTAGTSPIIKWHNGTTWVPLSSTGGSTKNVQSFSAFTNYSYGEMIKVNNLLYSSKVSFVSGAVFDVADWDIVSGDMTKSVYDKDNDGVVDFAEHAYVADIALETSLIQTWKPNTDYTTGQQIVYLNKLYTVMNDFISPMIFDTVNLDLTATGYHDELLHLQGGSPIAKEYYHLAQDEYDIVNKLSQSYGSLYFDSNVLGDMKKSIYDANNDGVIDKASTIVGLTASINELNFTQGVTSSIQTQINALTHGMVFKGFVATYADLLLVPTPSQGDTYIITADETQASAKTFYTRGTSSWTYLGPFSVNVRDFSISPLSISTESTGIVPENRIDAAIARLTDTHTHINLSLLETYTQTEANLEDAVLKKHAHANYTLLSQYTQTNTDIANAVNKTHSHSNISVLNNFSEDTSGRVLYNGALIVGTGTGGGITDLSMFNTADLAETTNKRYVSDAEKLNLGQIPSIISGQTTMDTKVTNILNVIPSDATTANKLVSASGLTSKLNALTFKSLYDVDHLVKNDSFIVTTSTGTVTYLQSIRDKIKIQKITDKNGMVYTDVPFLKLKTLEGSLLSDGTLELSAGNIYTTDLIDMPDTFVNNAVLVANSSSMAYELKDIGTLTNSKANFVKNVVQADWVYDTANNNYSTFVTHGLDSKNLIIGAYDVTGTYITTLSYKLEDANSIMITSTSNIPCTIVINCSQGTSGSGTGSTGSSFVTASDFIDDTRIRIDKTYSSSYFTTFVSNNYAQKSNTYTKGESDARFSSKINEHSHVNFNTLNKITEDLFGNMYFNGKKIVLDIQPRTYRNNWVSQDLSILTEFVNVNDVALNANFTAILASDFTVKNNIPSVDPVIDALPENQLRVVATDGTLTIVDVLIPPQSTQKYLLGISPNVKIFVQGKFDANYYLTAY
jgi:hypothetical protein